MQVLTQGYGVQPKTWHVCENKAAGYCRVYYVTGGTLTYSGEDQSIPLQAGHLYIFPSNLPFTITQDPADPLCCLWFHFDFFPSELDHLVDLPLSEALLHLLQAMIDEWQDSGGSSQLFRSLTQALYGHIRESGCIAEPDEKQAAMVELIRGHYRDPSFTIQGLSAEMGCSTEHFIRTFQAHVHLSPYKYVVRLRMAEAARLLLEGKRVGAVSESLGYTNPKIFARAFVKRYGMTPSLYRKQYQPIA